MNNFVPTIAVLLCAAMTGPIWLGQLQEEPTSVTERQDSSVQTTASVPAPTLTPAPEPDPNTRLACGYGIISRLRNRGDRCVPVQQPYVCPPQPYACPQPTYVYPQTCVPAQPQYVIPSQTVPTVPAQIVPSLPAETAPNLPAQSIPTQPIPSQPFATQPPASPPTAGTQGSGPCNCQNCCREFQLTRWRIVPEEQEVMEDYIDCEVETSRFCDSNCDSGECVETFGVQNRKRHVVKQKARRFTVTKLVQETVVETRCMECGCVKETRSVPTSPYETQKPLLDDEETDSSDSSEAGLRPLRLQPALRQSQQLEWLSPQGKNS